MLDALLGLGVCAGVLGSGVMVWRTAHERRVQLHRDTPRVTIPPAWQYDPRSFGASAWLQVGQRCPPLLGIAADHVLGRAVVDSMLATVLNTAPAENTCEPLADSITSASPEEEPNVFFKPGEPTSLAEYPGQAHVTEYLSALVNGTPPAVAMPSEHQLFLGPPGQGKTLLAKCLAASLTARNTRLDLPPVQFIELVPSDIDSAEQQDAIIRKAATRPTVLFIDEVHDLKERHALKLYLLLEEARYRFEAGDLVSIPDLLVVAATTDYGALHPALKRRFNRHFLEPLNADAMLGILRRQQFVVTEDGAQAIVARTKFSGAPWEALQVYRQARVYAQGRGAGRVEHPDVERAFEAQALDELGLTRLDRRVITALLGQPRYRAGRGVAKEFVCYGVSEQDVVAIAGIDRGEYRETIKPKLMSRGLLQVRATYGQTLTEQAVRTYGWLVRAG